MTTDITVCIPVYKAEAFVRDAIESVLAQTYDQFRLLISVDPAGDRSGEICREYETDPRVTVVENETRLGWVGNVNACLDRIDTPFFAFCFHDDAMEPIFLERLRAALIEAPNAVATFGAIQRIGTRDQIGQTVDVIGSPASRAAACIKGIFPAYGLKNLLRSGPVFQGLRLPSGSDEGYIADLPFALGYSLAGDFVAVPEIVYRKLHWADSVTTGWQKFDVERLARNETSLKLQMLRVIQGAQLDLKDRQHLVQLVLCPPRGYQMPSSSEDVLGLLESLEILSPTLLIAELLGSEPDSDCKFVDLNTQRAGHASNRVQLARNFKRASDVNTATHYTKQALRLDGESVAAHALMAQLTLTTPNLTKASPEFEQAHLHATKATELDHENPAAWVLLARVQIRLGRWSEAKASAEMALSLNPTNPGPARRLIARAEERSQPFTERMLRWMRPRRSAK